jgi:tyrosinase
MAVTRRDIAHSVAARDDFRRGVRLLKAERAGGDLSSYDVFVVWHFNAMMTGVPGSVRNAAHGGPSFLPWHRYMLMVFERALQRVLDDPAFGLPYWNWSDDGDQPETQQRQQPIWTDAYVGGFGEPVTDGPFTTANGFFVVRAAEPFQPMQSVRRGLGRAGTMFKLPETADVRKVIGASAYDAPPWDTGTKLLRSRLEGTSPMQMHNLIHRWVAGDMLLHTSPNDPVFYLHHANVDRIWTAWQQRYGIDNYAPVDTAGTDLAGHGLHDRLVSMLPGEAPMIADVLDVSAFYQYDRLDDLLGA